MQIPFVVPNLYFVRLVLDGPVLMLLFFVGFFILTLIGSPQELFSTCLPNFYFVRDLCLMGQF